MILPSWYLKSILQTLLFQILTLSMKENLDLQDKQPSQVVLLWGKIEIAAIESVPI
jgi:hypothetical protein